MSATPPARGRTLLGLPSPFWFLWLGAVVNKMGGFVLTFLALYLTTRRGFTVEAAGFVATLYGAGSICAGPVGGWLADRIGRRAAMAVATGLGAAAMINFTFARSDAAVCLSTMALGFCGDLYRPSQQAIVVDVVPPAERKRAFGYMHWGINLGFSIAALLGGWIASRSWVALFLADAATTVGLGAIVWKNVPETRPAAAGPRPHPLAPYRDGVFLGFALLAFLVGTIFQQSIVALPLDMKAHHVPPSYYGGLVALNGLLIVVAQPWGVRMASRFRRGRVLATGALCIGTGFGATALAHGVVGYAASILLWSVGEILVLPIASSVVADLSSPSLRGSYQGAYQMAWGAASLVAPMIGSTVLAHYGGRVLWTGCAVAGVVASLGHLAHGVARRKRIAALAQPAVAATG